MADSDVQQCLDDDDSRWAIANGSLIALLVAPGTAIRAVVVRISCQRKLERPGVASTAASSRSLSELDAAMDEHYKDEDRRLLAAEVAQQLELKAKSRP